jgi:hypothetical protein
MSDDKPRFQWSATEIVGIGIDNPERVRKTEDGLAVLMPTTYICPLHQKSGEWPDNPCPVCASNALKLDLLPLDTPSDAPRLEGAWTCEIEKTAPAVVGLPDNGGEE